MNLSHRSITGRFREAYLWDKANAAAQTKLNAHTHTHTHLVGWRGSILFFVFIVCDSDKMTEVAMLALLLTSIFCICFSFTYILFYFIV